MMMKRSTLIWMISIRLLTVTLRAKARVEAGCKLIPILNMRP